jgi:hypothetical protein
LKGVTEGVDKQICGKALKFPPEVVEIVEIDFNDFDGFNDFNDLKGD